MFYLDPARLLRIQLRDQIEHDFPQLARVIRQLFAVDCHFTKYIRKAAKLQEKNAQIANVYAASEHFRSYRLRRAAWLRSMPDNSAANSCAVISRRFSPCSENGIA